jgi:hypothetical protein
MGVKRHTLHIRSVLDTFLYFLNSLSCLSLVYPLHIPLLHNVTSRLDLTLRHSHAPRLHFPLSITPSRVALTLTSRI